MSATPAVLFACNAAVEYLQTGGATISAVDLSTGGFRLEGTRAGQRLVVELTTMRSSTQSVKVSLAVQEDQRLRQHKSLAVDYTAATMAALGYLL